MAGIVAIHPTTVVQGELLGFGAPIYGSAVRYVVIFVVFTAICEEKRPRFLPEDERPDERIEQEVQPLEGNKVQGGEVHEMGVLFFGTLDHHS